MEDAHLSLRLPDALADALDRAAAAKGLPKSKLVREAVAQYLTGGAPRPNRPPRSAREFLLIWDALPHLSVDEATRFDTDIQSARSSLAPPVDPWA
jgi:hypothetical protein